MVLPEIAMHLESGLFGSRKVNYDNDDKLLLLLSSSLSSSSLFFCCFCFLFFCVFFIQLTVICLAWHLKMC